MRSLRKRLDAISAGNNAVVCLRVYEGDTEACVGAAYEVEHGRIEGGALCVFVNKGVPRPVAA